MQCQFDVNVERHLHDDVGKGFLLFVHVLDVFFACNCHVAETACSEVGELRAVDFGNMEGVKCLAGLAKNIIAKPLTRATKRITGDLAPIGRVGELCRGSNGAEFEKLFVEQLNNGLLETHHDDLSVWHRHRAKRLEIIRIPLCKVLLPGGNEALDSKIHTGV